MEKMKRQNLILAVLATIILLSAVPDVFASQYGPGRVGVKIWAGRSHEDAGIGGIWNSRDKLHMQLDPAEGWRIKKVHMYVGADPIPVTSTGNPKIGHFPFKEEYPSPYTKEADDGHIFRRTLVVDLEEQLEFKWGRAYEPMRIINVAVHMDLVKFDDTGKIIEESGAWAAPELIIIEENEQTQEVLDTVLEGTGEVAGEIQEESEDDKRGDRKRVAKNEHQKMEKTGETEEVVGVEEFDGGRWGWWFKYELAHPKKGHVVDSAVVGIKAETPTFEGLTDDTGGFDFFPGEKVEFSIGPVPITVADSATKVTPLDMFQDADMDDIRVINMARLLQSLDADGNTKQTINITEDVGAYFNNAMIKLGVESLDFTDSDQIEAIINETIEQSKDPEGNTLMVAVSAEDAAAHLEAVVSNDMVRKNVSKTPEFISGKGKLDIMQMYFPARMANGEPPVTSDGVEGIPYYDPNGVLLEVRTDAKPLIASYEDEVDQSATGFRPASDIFVSISRDDGLTWKRKNISRTADRSSIELELTGEPFPGNCQRHAQKIIGNKIMLVWVSTYTRGGRPRYSIKIDDPTTPEIEDDYPYDDPYYVRDIFGVSGPQRIVNYDEVDDVADQGIGEIPYYCLWTARGVIITAEMLETEPWNGVDENGEPFYEEGDIVWYKPERLTSGRRDAYIPVIDGAKDAGFAVSWQEDPEGLRPGKGKGSGHGWSGAVANHKTDVWYSFIKDEDFLKIDENFESHFGQDDSELDEYDADSVGDGRLKALVPMSMPVRLSDNDVVNTDNLKVELDADGYPVLTNGSLTPLSDVDPEIGDGTHAYGWLLGRIGDEPIVDNGDAYPYEYAYNSSSPLWDMETLYEFTNKQGALKRVIITKDNRYLDGDTAGTRINIKMEAFTKPDGTKSAWVVLAYEETKGLGEGEPADHDEVDSDGDSGDGIPTNLNESVDDGKCVIYHTFEFDKPDIVSQGNIVNLPSTFAPEEIPALMLNEAGEPKTNIFDVSSGAVDVMLAIYRKTYVLAEDESAFNVYIVDYDIVGLPGYPIDADGKDIDPGVGDPLNEEFVQYERETARRVRFLSQSASKVGSSKTAMLLIYKQGRVGQGRPADVFGRRVVIPDGFNPKVDNPYDFRNFAGPSTHLHTFEGVSYTTETRGHINLTATTPTVCYGEKEVADDNGTPDDPTDDTIVYKKVVNFKQTPDNLGDESYLNPYPTSKGHRGFIRGDFIAFGYSHCPNWAAGRNGRDKYDFYVRRSFDGGQTWTTLPAGGMFGVTPELIDPATTTIPDDFTVPGGTTVLFTYSFPPYPEGETVDILDPDWVTTQGGVLEEITYALQPGEFEPARNASNLPNSKETVLDPRITGTPSTITTPDYREAYPEDTQDKSKFFVSFGTGFNYASTGGETDTPEAPPLDLYYSQASLCGDRWYETEWEVNPDSSGNYAGQTIRRWDWLAHGDPEQGEAQIRSNPSGDFFYSVWHQHMPEELADGQHHFAGDDIWFRRIMMPGTFIYE